MAILREEKDSQGKFQGLRDAGRAFSPPTSPGYSQQPQGTVKERKQSPPSKRRKVPRRDVNCLRPRSWPEAEADPGLPHPPSSIRLATGQHPEFPPRAWAEPLRARKSWDHSSPGSTLLLTQEGSLLGIRVGFAVQTPHCKTGEQMFCPHILSRVWRLINKKHSPLVIHAQTSVR